jgi:hypothetical protein
MSKNGLTKGQLEIIVEAVLKEQQKQDNKKKEHKKDWRLRNTKMLLKNYHLLQKHCDEITEDLEAFEEVIFDPEELNLRSLMKYKAKTKKMLDYFDNSWGSYQSYCKNRGSVYSRRCDVLYKLYISPNEFTKIKIAELYNMDERTVRRDEKKALEELSVFLFGIDSLSDLEQLIL